MPGKKRVHNSVGIWADISCPFTKPFSIPFGIFSMIRRHMLFNCAVTWRIVTAVLKMLNVCRFNLLKNQTPNKSIPGLSDVKIGGIFHDSGHCTRSGIRERLEKHQ
jgi:hypothetical protein